MSDETITGPPADVVPGHDDATLWERFAERVRYFSMRRLHDVALAEDVAQETLQRVATALRAGRVDNVAALPAFVFQTASHVCLQHLRSAGRESRALSRLAIDPALQGDAHDPLASLISEERRRMVHAALVRLDVADQSLLHALYFEHQDPAQLAAELGVTPAAFRVRKHRAIRRLAALLPDRSA